MKRYLLIIMLLTSCSDEPSKFAQKQCVFNENMKIKGQVITVFSGGVYRVRFMDKSGKPQLENFYEFELTDCNKGY